MRSWRLREKPSVRPAAAALEFCIVAALLFLIFLAMIEVGRAMMVLGVVAQSARAGARVGATAGGTYGAVVQAVRSNLAEARVGEVEEVTVTVGETVVHSDSEFRAAAQPGVAISVRVRVPYARVSWLPAGTRLFLSPTQQLSETAVFCREG